MCLYSNQIFRMLLFLPFSHLSCQSCSVSLQSDALKLLTVLHISSLTLLTQAPSFVLSPHRAMHRSWKIINKKAQGMYNDQNLIQNQMLNESELFLAAPRHVSFDLTAALVQSTQIQSALQILSCYANPAEAAGNPPTCIWQNRRYELQNLYFIVCIFFLYARQHNDLIIENKNF